MNKQKNENYDSESLIIKLSKILNGLEGDVDMEHEQQVAVIRWFRLQYPNYKMDVFAIPNGAILCDLPKNKRLWRMRYLLSEGFIKGASDLFIAVPSGPFHGLFLEMKDEGKTVSSLSTEQREFLAMRLRRGYAAQWAAGFSQAKKIIEEYMRQDKQQ